MKAENAKLNDEKTIKTIWKELFQDTDEFIEPFFKARFSKENCYLIKDRENIVSFLFAIPSKLVYAGGKKTDALNIMGVLTVPQYRGKGLMSLMFDKLKSDYDIPMVLYPEEYIRKGYEKQGFESSLSGKFLYIDNDTVRQSRFEKERVKELYCELLNEFGGLERDEYAWNEIFSDNVVFSNDKSYTIYSSYHSSREAYINDEELLSRLRGSVKALPTSFMKKLNLQDVPFGMGYKIQSPVFIPEQY